MYHLLLSSVYLIVLVLVHITNQSPIHRRQVVSHDYRDRSCENQTNKCRSETKNCTSLKEVLVDSYGVDEGVRLNADTPYLIFSAFDLFYSGLISDEDAPRANQRIVTLESEPVETMSQDNCQDLLDNVKLSKKDTAECQWSYTCKYNPNYFPSFTVAAKLDDSSQAAKCDEIFTSSTKFVRTACMTNSEEDHWCKCEADRIITGYKYQS